MVHVASIVDKRTIEVDTSSDGGEGNIEKYGVTNVEEMKVGKVRSVSRKALEERERRALRLAEEGLSHVNQKVSLGAALGQRPLPVGCL